MKQKKKPIQRSLVLGASLFISFLSFVLSLQSYFSFSKSMYARYNEQLSTIVHFLDSQIDKDDLYNCIQTKTPSEKFNRLQQLENSMVDEFGLFYLYAAYPGDTSMYSICSATNREERERGESDYTIMEAVPGYTPEVLQEFQKVMNGNEIVFFEEDSEWGAAYTACIPLINSQGIHYGVICADISIQSLHQTMQHYVIFNLILTIALGILFGILLIIWLRRNITNPILLLEESTQDFAQKCHGEKDPDAVFFDPPEIHTHNEVESLSNAITQMATDMRQYIKHMISAEETAKNAEEKAADMTLLDYKDPLTHVGSKAAYEETRQIEEQAIQNGKTSVAIAMIDLNRLKFINDTYGHDHGDEYISGSCQMICQIFKHSAIFRFGGDEFVVLLKAGGDFENRNALVEKTKQAFLKTQNDTTQEPWKRFSAAIGLAEFTPGDTLESLFKRADANMYQNKVQMKAARKD